MLPVARSSRIPSNAMAVCEVRDSKIVSDAMMLNSLSDSPLDAATGFDDTCLDGQQVHAALLRTSTFALGFVGRGRGDFRRLH